MPANPAQPDLHYLRTILVSTGWNKNNHVFLPEEVWRARHTAEDKPVNFQHDCRDIIGHITANVAVGEDGKPLESDQAPGGHWHVETQAVLYGYWSDEALQKRMNGLIADMEADPGKWSVSMECLFTNYDFALVPEDRDMVGTGEVGKLVARNKQTAFLDKYLVTNGGDGRYENYKVGQVLRNIVFAGKGVVKKPANPDSVILAVAKEENMAEINVEALQQSLASAQQELAQSTARASALEGDKTNLTRTLEEVEAARAALSTEKDSLVAKLAEAVQKATDLEAKLVLAHQTIEGLERDRTTASRVQAAVKALAMAETEATQFVQASLSLPEEAFQTQLTLMKAALDKVQAEVKTPPVVSDLPAPMAGEPRKVMTISLGKKTVPGGLVTPAGAAELLDTAEMEKTPALAVAVETDGVEAFRKEVQKYFE